MRHNKHGWTLLEIMVCVVIIGILAMLAIPKYTYSMTRAKQREAMLVLKQIYVMQRAYWVEHSQYFIPPAGTFASASNPTGLAPIYVGQAGVGKYSYSVVAVGSGFEAHAISSVLDDDPTADEWVIDDKGIMQNVTDDSRS